MRALPLEQAHVSLAGAKEHEVLPEEATLERLGAHVDRRGDRPPVAAEQIPSRRSWPHLSEPSIEFWLEHAASSGRDRAY